MTRRTIIGAALAVAGIAAAWWIWGAVDMLRGTILFELRYPLILAAAILAFSALDWLAKRVGGGAKDGEGD